MQKATPACRQFPLVLIGSIAAILAVPSAKAADLYWDVNGSDAGPGTITSGTTWINGTWGAGAYNWTTDPIGASDTSSTALPTAGDMVYIASGAATAGAMVTGTINVVGSQYAKGLVVQAGNSGTGSAIYLAGSGTLNLGSSGISIPSYSDGVSTGNVSRFYINNVNLTTDQIWTNNSKGTGNNGGIYITGTMTGSGNLTLSSTTGFGLMLRDDSFLINVSNWTGNLTLNGGGISFWETGRTMNALLGNASRTLTLQNTGNYSNSINLAYSTGALHVKSSIVFAGTGNGGTTFGYFNNPGIRGCTTYFDGTISGTTSSQITFAQSKPDLSGTGQLGTFRITGDNRNWASTLSAAGTAVNIRYGYLVLENANALGLNNSMSVNIGLNNSSDYTASGLLATSGNNVSGNIALNGGASKGGEAFLGLDGTGAVTYSGSVKLQNTSAATSVSNLHLRAISGGTVTFTGNIGDNASTSSTANAAVIVDGGGKVILTGTNSTYFGGTYVNAGSLQLDFAHSSAANNILNSAANRSALTMGGGTLDLQGKDSVANSQRFNGTTINKGSSTIQLAKGTSGSLALTLGALARNAGGTVDFVLPSDAQTASNGITTTTTSVSNGVLVSAASNGVAYATVGSADWAALSGSNVVALSGYNANSFTAADNADVTADGSVADGSTVNTLRFNDSTARTLTLQGQTTVSTGGVLLTSTAASGATITGGSLKAGGGNELVLINNGGKMTVNSVIADGVGGASALTVSGSGVTELGGVNTYSGVTTVNNGTLSISSTAALGTGASAIILGDNGHKGTLSYTGLTDTLSRGLGIVAGGGELDVTTAGQTLTLGGTVSNITTTVTASTTGVAATYGNFTIGGAGNVTVNNALNLGYGGLVMNGTGLVTLGGTTVAVATAVSGATSVTVANAAGLEVGQFITGTGIRGGTMITAINGTTLTISQTTSAAINSGSLVFSTGNSYSGDTVLNSGTVKLGAYAALSATTVLRVNSGGTLDLGGFSTNTMVAAAYLNGGVIQNGTYNLGVNTLYATSGTVSAVLTGGGAAVDGSIFKSGPGTLMLSSANTYSGTTFVNEGTLLYGNNNVIGTGTVAISGGTVDMGAYSDTVGVVTMSSGTLASTSGTLTATAYNFTGSGTVTARLSGTTGITLTKSGAGTVTLSGSNNYNGATTINEGKLAVNGVNTSSPITVNSGGTLAGSGTVGAVTVNSGAHFAPGNSITTTFKTGALTLNAGSTTDVELGTASASRTLANSATTNDRTTVGGALTLGGTLNLIDNANADGLGQAGAGSYLIFTGASSVTGAFGSVSGITGYHAAVNTTATPGNVYVDLNYYAKAGFSAVSGGTIDEIDATHFTLSLGSADANTGIATASITLDNVLRDAVYQDLLGGLFDTDGKGSFSLSGFDGTLSAIQSGDSVMLTVNFDTTGATAGTYTGSILFTPTSTNAAGSETLNAINLGLTFEVTQVPEPATWSMIVGGLGVMAFVQRARRRMSR